MVWAANANHEMNLERNHCSVRIVMGKLTLPDVLCLCVKDALFSNCKQYKGTFSTILLCAINFVLSFTAWRNILVRTLNQWRYYSIIVFPGKEHLKCLKIDISVADCRSYLLLCHVLVFY